MDAIEYLKTRTRMTSNCTIKCDECCVCVNSSTVVVISSEKHN